MHAEKCAYDVLVTGDLGLATSGVYWLIISRSNLIVCLQLSLAIRLVAVPTNKIVKSRPLDNLQRSQSSNKTVLGHLQGSILPHYMCLFRHPERSICRCQIEGLN